MTMEPMSADFLQSISVIIVCHYEQILSVQHP